MRKFLVAAVLFSYCFSLLSIPYVQAQQLSVQTQSKNSRPGVRSLGNAPDTQVGADFGASTPSTSIDMGVAHGANNYQIHVLGEVQRPGAYRVNPSDRVTDALRYAGGLLANGSQRRIQLRRDSEVKALDIYAYKYKGILDENPYLVENDVVYVPLKKGEIQVEGPVNRPGFYEISRPITLDEALKLAGGFTTGLSNKQPIRIIRYTNEEEKKIIEVNLSQESLKKMNIRAGDVIVVPHILLANKEFDYNISRIPGDNIFYPTINDNVYVIGAVTTPGSFPFQPNLRAEDYIGLAGPTNGSSMARAKLITATGKKMPLSRAREINPGDTILIPSRAITFGSVLQVFNAVTGVILTTIAVKNNL